MQNIVGLENGGANSNGEEVMITLPFTFSHAFLSMMMTQIMVLSDSNYSFNFNSQNYFSFAVAAFLGITFFVLILVIRYSSTIRFKDSKKEQLSNYGEKLELQLIKVKTN